MGSTPTLSAGPQSTDARARRALAIARVATDRTTVELPMRCASGRSLTRRLTGEVTERPKVHDWKSCVSERVPRVRIPPSPPVAGLFERTDAASRRRHRRGAPSSPLRERLGAAWTRVDLTQKGLGDPSRARRLEQPARKASVCLSAPAGRRVLTGWAPAASAGDDRAGKMPYRVFHARSSVGSRLPAHLRLALCP